MLNPNETMPYPPPAPRKIDPTATLPLGLTDPRFEAFISSRLDDHFAPKADKLFDSALHNCRVVMEHGTGGPGANELAFNFAKAAAHWRKVAEDYRRGDVLVEGVTLIEAS